MLFSQVLPVLLAITASIGNKSLMLFDVKYGISLTASPVSIYVSYSAARELLGIPNSLFKRLREESKGQHGERLPSVYRRAINRLLATQRAVSMTVSSSSL
jgi:hypothetical protein